MAQTQKEVKNWQKVAREYLDKAGIALTTEEQDTIEISDLGLGEFEQTGVALVVYFNDEKYCAKEMVLMPSQTCPSTCTRQFQSLIILVNRKLSVVDGV